MTPREPRPDAPANPLYLDLLAALAHGMWPLVVVPLALRVVERDPLASAGFFRGDVLRGLMEVPGPFWGRQPRLYERYRLALRASVAARRALPYDERMQFWLPLDLPALHEHIERACDEIARAAGESPPAARAGAGGSTSTPSGRKES